MSSCADSTTAPVPPVHRPLDPPKKRKIDQGEDVSTSTSKEDSTSNTTSTSLFQHFKLVKVLREDARQKFISLHGVLPSTNSTTEENAVVLLERKPFDVASIERCLHTARTSETLHNDIYSTHDVFSSGLSPVSDVKATVIHPATEKHIKKYGDHEAFIVHETPELYRTVTEPCISENMFSFQWVYNILEKKTEADRIVIEDPDPELGFILLPDMKWDRKNKETLYLVAIVHKHGLRSIRDLRREHLPLLENIYCKGVAAIGEKFQVTPEKLRIYFHYQPSYYHLHVHFTHINFDAPGSDVMRAHLLNDVIDNLKIDSDFYQKKTLSYVVRDDNRLYECYKENHYFDNLAVSKT